MERVEPVTMAWIDAMDRLRAGGCTITAPEGEGGCWRLDYEGNPAAFPMEALQRLAREAGLHPELGPKVLPLLRDAVACLSEQLEPDAHERKDLHGMRQRLSALFAVHWSLLERDVGRICRHGLHRPDEVTLRAAMELAMFLRNARTEACVCEAAVRSQRVDLAIGYCQAQGFKAAADRLPLLIELMQHIETPAEACRYLAGMARWVKSLPRTTDLLDARPLLDFAVRFLGGLRDAKTGLAFTQAAQGFLQALIDSGRLSPADQQAMLRTMVNGLAGFVQTQAWPPSV